MDGSPLSKLSPELRNHIWEYAVTMQHPVKVAACSDPDLYYCTRFEDPAITAACKQTRSESLLMYYAKNKFEMDIAHEGTWLLNPDCFDQPADAWEWLDTINRAKHDAVSYLKINICGIPYWFAVDLDNEENGWVLMMGKIKECGYDESRVELAAFHALAELPVSDERDREDVKKTEAEIEKLRGIIR
ncbi:hypothetical protein LTR36_004397 [Oleoguttula mirabilis]|uniref:2EXR domain-containing protein n=1 Tax=Oleoguttula mirabilis TaxID=1507867 RepID=A0AAV9JH43_9PEZI|nr:hypothetical protein LTR36_004397 [Oleoguttula mirabilis]